MTYLEYNFNDNESRAEARKNLENLILSMSENHYNKNNLIIEREENKKPYFKNANNLYFNGTHSSELFAAVMSDEYNVGIDAEKIRERDYFAIAEEYFYKSEIEYLKNTHKLEIDFFTIWTIKEAYIKMLGKTIFDIKNSVEVDLIEREVRNADNIFFASFILDDSYIISICFDTKNDVDLNIQDFNLNMLFAYPVLPNININM
ncbi:4'-phosphopantetheinyl transferase superfamily protein [Brachyspira hyodysenteriae]|uniref:4'-phosphopantetheinyl transferase family protein n=1 Tax=Brachyspira hyodysenteriae TaxID=159 RepID=UPI0022CD8D48|nr:4'-phosphopantetheinyl transferase superfamily protein [Brachyspira hyodysenteriae]MDA0001029.1 4'-phosphopantetheinyl transferase superfamily protein [Brachyspira hyodysenteriae]MDA0034474.1 4'-phosphopantetheinyl transferase superfamily protein [Brachyspira hyodysenteriae]MDA0041123.1 4'-phosphopantetheinyl transferase superfamily protein [Brachyspira hyodysenteriae]MDA0048549.1 4'-phosphopantetheinyl transferase superfamily protein [Brachyspira hyodysenteriae]MDA1468787.1 4'-phosphopante